MSSLRRIAHALVAIALLDREPDPNACKVCGSSAKASSGECANCGVYVCKECGKGHLGEPRPCPGMGVPIEPEGADNPAP